MTAILGFGVLLLAIRGAIALLRDLSHGIGHLETTVSRAWQAIQKSRRERQASRDRIRQQKREHLGLVQAAATRDLASAMADLVLQLNELRSENARLKNEPVTTPFPIRAPAPNPAQAS